MPFWDRFVAKKPSKPAPVQLQSTMSFKSIGEPCRACRGDKLMSFLWELAGKGEDDHQYPVATFFVSPEPLRFGTLYACKYCGRPWYLDPGTGMMCAVSRERVTLVREWNRAPIVLGEDLLRALKQVGETPPDIYGNGSRYCETPCGVVTKSGERLDIATISFQRHAPFEEWRSYRLGSEISEIYPSPFALPLPVRLATAQAEEMRMGFYPTLIEMPDGRPFVLNGRPDFFVKAGYRAAEAVLSKKRLDFSNMPELANTPKTVVRFVADADP